MATDTAVERLKAKLLGELHLMRPADLAGYWRQVTWPKPNLITLAQKPVSPLAEALKMLPAQIRSEATRQPDPFGWILAKIDVKDWSNWCQEIGKPWMGRVWLATASHLRAQHRLVHKAHGWSNDWEELRRHPQDLRCVDNMFLAELRHAAETRHRELLSTPGLDERLAKARQEKDEAFLRRLRRAKQGTSKRTDVVLAEKVITHCWLQLSPQLPGLCFLGDMALDALLTALGLNTGTAAATKQIRTRLGLIQAGAKQHLIEEVIDLDKRLRFRGSLLSKDWVFTGKVVWGNRQLWPR